MRESRRAGSRLEMIERQRGGEREREAERWRKGTGGREVEKGSGRQEAGQWDDSGQSCGVVTRGGSCC
eukprot:766712-Hanusia_phi.AAC.4